MTYEKSKQLAQFINDKISYAERHKKSELELLYDFVDAIADTFEIDDDRLDWYNLCNTIEPEKRDENAIS